MVKVGFIVEGDTEKIIFESDTFKKLLRKFKIECIDVFNAEGQGNFRHQNPTINSFFKILADKSAEKVFLVSDLENAPCVTQAKEDICTFNTAIQINIIVVKAIESWFLADSKALSQLLKARVHIKEPEQTSKTPFYELSKLLLQKLDRGPGNKKVLAKKMLKSGFSIEYAAKHPNCNSAEYFVKKLKEMNL
jgi:hypothetical protein